MAFDPTKARPATPEELARLGIANAAPAGNGALAGARPATQEELIRLGLVQPEQATAGSALVGGFRQLGSSIGTLADAITGDPNESALRSIRESERIAREQGAMPSLERTANVYSEQGLLPAVGQAVSDVPEAAAGQVANLASTVGGAKVGSMLGAGFGPAGAIVGGGIGALAGSIPQNFAENLRAQAQEQLDRGEPVDVSTLSALGTAVAQGVLDVGSVAVTFGRSLVGRIVGGIADKAVAEKRLVDAAQKTLAQTRQTATQTLPRAVGAGVVRGAAVEMPTEIAQTILTRAQAGSDLLSDEALSDYGESAYMAGLVGGPLGGAAAPLNRGAARSELERQGIDYQTGAAMTTPERDADRVERLKAEQASKVKAREEREARRAEQLAQYEAPVDVTASPDDLQAELGQLRSIIDDEDSALRGPQVRDRIKRIEQALTIQEREPARRARVAQEAARNLGPDLQARYSAEVFVRDSVAQRSDQELQSELAQLRGRRDTEADLTRKAIQDELKFRAERDRFNFEQRVNTEVPKLDSAVLANRQESLRAKKDRSAQDNFELQQINTELRERARVQREQSAELKRLREQGEQSRADLSPALRAEQAAQAFTQERAQGELYLDPQVLAAQRQEPTQTQEDIPGATVRRRTVEGVGSNSTYARQLGRLDLENPDQFAQAQRIAAQAQQDTGLTRKAKQNIQTYVDKFARQEPLPSQQLAMDFEAAQGPRVFNQEFAGELGFGKNSLAFKSVAAQNLDPADPRQRETLKEIIDTWLEQGSYKAQRQALQDYRQQLDQMEAGQDARPITGTTTPVPTPERGAAPTGVAMAGRREPGAGAPAPTVANVPTEPDRGGLEPAGQTAEQPAGPGVQPTTALEPATRTPELIRAERAVTESQARERLRELYREREKLLDANRRAPTKKSKNYKAWQQLQAQIEEADVAALEAVIDSGLARREGLVYAMRSDARVLLQADGEAPGALSTELAARLDMGDVQGALQAIRTNTDGVFNPMEVALARRILDSGNTLPTLQVVETLPDLEGGITPAGQYDARTDTITLAAQHADSHTFLHELIHAFTHKFLVQQDATGYRHPAAKGLLDVYAHVKRMRPNLDAYGVTNISEFAAEAMSNRAFQGVLMGIPYRKQTAWSWFTKAVKSFFGVKDSDPVQNTAWAAIVHVDGLMRPGRAAQLDYSQDVPNPIANVVANVLTPPGSLTPDEIRSIPPAAPQQQREGLRTFGSAAHQGDNVPSVGTRIRSTLVDAFAPIEQKLATLYNQGIRDGMGYINPINFMRQASDAGRMAMEFFRKGGLRRRPDGYWEVDTLKGADGQPSSVMRAVDMLAAWGKANGLDYTAAKARAATVFEHMRLNDLRAYNAQLEQDAQAFEAQNTRKGDEQADRLREKIIPLHAFDAEIDAMVDVFQRSPELQEVRRVLNETRFNAIDAMVAAGRITEERGKFWKDNINYVPFNRIQEVFETSSVTERIGRSGLADLGSIPAIKGSYKREVANSIDNYMNSLSWMVTQALKTSATRDTLEAMVRAGYATRLPNQRSDADNPNLVVASYENGEPVYYEMDNEYDLAAFSHNRLDTDSDLMRLFTAVARIMRATITAMPTFSVNQVVQDTQRSALQSGTKSATRVGLNLLATFPKEFANAWRGKRSEAGERLHGFGIVGAVDFNPTNPIDAIEYEAGALKHGLAGRFLHTLEQVAKASDQAARQAVYERTMMETGGLQDGDMALAITRAREVINYNRRGTSKFAQVLSHTVPFFNAYAQGLDLIYRGLTGKDSPTGLDRQKARRYVRARLGMLMTLGFVYAAAMGDDEDYKNADDFVRDRAWILPRALTSAFDSADGRHTPLAIPVPRDWGFLFKGIPERVMQFVREQAEGTGQSPERAVASAVESASRAFLMEPIPTAIKPFLEHLTNYSFFTGRELVPRSMADTPAAMQYGRTTSEFAKAIGAQFNVSPMVVDNYVRSVFGIMGQQASIVVDSAMNGNLPERPIDKVVAGISVFTAPEVGTRPLTEFYALREKILEAGAVYNNYADNPQLAEDLLQDRMKYLPFRSWAQRKTDQLSTLRAIETAVRTNEGLNMTPRERRMYLKELNQARNDLLADVGPARNILEGQE